MNKSEKILQNVKRDYNSIAEHFSKTRVASGSSFQLFLEYIRSGQKILDLGCGNGRLFNFFNQRNLAIDYYGLDNSSGLIEICKEKYPQIADRFIIGDILSLPYEDNFFNSIMSIAAFHHLPTRELRIRALKEMYRVLKPGGTLLMTNWHLWHQPYFKYWFNQFWQKISWKDFFVPWKGPDGQIKCHRYYHAFTKRELGSLLAKAGFKTEKIFADIKRDVPNYGRRVNLVSIAKKPA